MTIDIDENTEKKVRQYMKDNNIESYAKALTQLIKLGGKARELEN